MARRFLMAAIVLAFISLVSFVSWLVQLLVANMADLLAGAQASPMIALTILCAGLALVTVVVGAVLAQYPRWR